MLYNEYLLIKKYIEEDINPTNGLDLGCGPSRQAESGNHDCQAFKGILTGVDSNPNFCPDICCNILDLTTKFKKTSMQFITLVHTLEDLENPYECLRIIADLLSYNGICIIICPYRYKYHRIGTKGANMGHKYDFEPHDLEYMIWKSFGQLKKNYEILSKDTLNNNYSFEIVLRKKCKDIKRGNAGFFHMWEDDGTNDPRRN